MITFERTHNLELIRSILTDSCIWPHVTDDTAGDRREFQVNEDPRIWSVLATDGCQVIGLFTFLPHSTVRWEVHLVLERKRRIKGTVIAQAGLQWMFENSTARRIIAEIPACNRLAVKLAGRVMTQFAVDRCSFLKHGILQDLILFGISKG